MKFTLSWLKQHLKTDASLDHILRTLDQLGLVVDKVENQGELLAPFVICEILEASPHPNADRLKVCRVNTGSETLQVVCGAPNACQGMKAVLALPGVVIPSTGVPLKVGVVRGVESSGMMCSAEELLLEKNSEGIIEVEKEAPLGQSYSVWKGLDEVILDLEITPNRGDCLGVYGIARDLAAAGIGILVPLENIKIPGKEPCSQSVVLNTKACPYFTGRLIRGVRNGPSPEWLRRRLESIGLRSISALVDVTNYFTFDRARPLHVFDADLLEGPLLLRAAKAGELFVALDEVTYSLAEGMTVICDDAGVISLGGIIGGKSTGCSEATQNVFLESAWFDPIMIAETGRKLGILSDARFRFERGVDPLSTLPGLEAATQMILEICGGEASDVIEVGAPPSFENPIKFTSARVQSLGGLEVSPERNFEILTSLGFRKRGDEVIPPSWRSDVGEEADLVEEVLRVEGYDKIPPVPYEGRPEGHPLGPLQERRFVVRDKLANQGLVETVTWSFMALEDAKLFGGVPDDLRIANPISHNLSAMRPSLIPNLLKAVLFNQHRGRESVMVFEMGPQYEAPTEEGQHMMATGLRAGVFPGNWLQKKRPVDFYDVKADVSTLLEGKGQWEVGGPSWYHPGRSATVKLGPQVLGYCGELHPRVLATFDVKGPIVGFEIFLDRLPLPKQKVSSRPLLFLSPYQAVERDFAFVVPSDVPAGLLLQIATKSDPQLVESVALFDVFERENGEKSLGLRVRLQPKTHTLEDAEIQAFSEKLIQEICKKTGGILRGASS